MTGGDLHSHGTGWKRRVFWRTVGLFGPYKWRLLALTVLISAMAALSLIPALVIGGIVNEATQADSRASRINELFVLLIVIVVLAQLIGVAVGYLNEHIGQGLMHRLRQRLHTHLQAMSVGFFTQARTGEILSRVSTDVNGVEGAVTQTVTEFLRNSLTMLVAIGLMFALEWRLALIAIVVLPLWVYPTIRLGQILRGLRRQWHDENAEMAAHLEETLSVSGAMLVKTFGREEHEARRFRESSERLRTSAIRRAIIARWFDMGNALFGAIAPGFVYWYGGRAVSGDDLDIGTVVAFAVITTSIFQPFAGITRVNTTFISSLALFERIFEYLDLPIEMADRPGTVELHDVQGSIKFDAVTFSYGEGHQPALDMVTLEVKPGQTAALVGPSGAGKTTTTYLIQRFYDPQQGRILLDGHDLRDMKLESVASAVGAVMQETYLFHASLMDNIRYGRLDATDDEVDVAAASAGLRPFIARLPDGLATIVGERGFRLSGGEQQRVSIARAILKDPQVLILDEATASLDSRLEREIRESIRALTRDRTTIVIAHRLSTVAMADVIFVFDEGRVTESGGHQELLDRGGLYASLHREQFAETHSSRR